MLASCILQKLETFCLSMQQVFKGLATISSTCNMFKKLVACMQKLATYTEKVAVGLFPEASNMFVEACNMLAEVCTKFPASLTFVNRIS